MKCFKCNKKIKIDEYGCLITNAVRFHGGNEYGSTIFDALIDGVFAEIVICDECLEKYKKDVYSYKLEKQDTKKIYLKGGPK